MEPKTTKISPMLISRLPAYYRVVCAMEAEGIDKITSQDIAKRLGNTPAQVRHDFFTCGGVNSYKVANLREWLEEYLGIRKKHRLVIVGAGNIGRAIMSFEEFREKNFFITAAFDSNLMLESMQVSGIPILNAGLFEGYIAENGADIIVVTAPAQAAQNILEVAEKYGVPGIWNFAPVDLQSETVKIRNVHLGDSLMSLSLQIEGK